MQIDTGEIFNIPLYRSLNHMIRMVHIKYIQSDTSQRIAKVSIILRALSVMSFVIRNYQNRLNLKTSPFLHYVTSGLYKASSNKS